MLDIWININFRINVKYLDKRYTWINVKGPDNLALVLVILTVFQVSDERQLKFTAIV